MVYAGRRGRAPVYDSRFSLSISIRELLCTHYSIARKSHFSLKSKRFVEFHPQINAVDG